MYGTKQHFAVMAAAAGHTPVMSAAATAPFTAAATAARANQNWIMSVICRSANGRAYIFGMPALSMMSLNMTISLVTRAHAAAAPLARTRKPA